MSSKVTRRRFLSRTAAAAGVVFAGPSLFDLDELLAQPNWVRPDIATASASIINGYKTAITAMRALPANNPRSWAYQAAIHGTTVMPALTAWNTCQHGNFFFLSWHRMYLYWFERIVRSMSGVPSWALPFWNYRPTPVDPVASNRVLPLPFRNPANATNPLFTANRNATINNGTGSLSATICDPSVALMQTAFTGPAVNFGGNNPGTGQLENRPHNNVHVAIGGWMGNPQTAAQDPIFWLHHANIDRYWNVWLKQGGGRADPTNNTTWRNRVFTFFRENGTQVTMTACDILNASAQLHYTYQGEPPQVTQSCPPVIKFPLPQFIERPIKIPIPDPEMIIGEARAVTRVMQMKAVPAEVMRDAQAAIAAPDKNLILNFATVQADAQPGAVFEVWVGPEGTPGPGVAGAHQVGNIALFAQGIRGVSHQGEEKASFSFKLDDAVAPALARGAADIRIAVIPTDPVEVGGKRGLKKPAAPLRITDMSVTVEEQRK
jgi:tyrosinase